MTGEVSTKLGKAQLMTMSAMRSVAEAAGVQYDAHVLLHVDNVSEGGDDSDRGHAEPIRDLYNLSDHSAGSVSSLQQIQ